MKLPLKILDLPVLILACFLVLLSLWRVSRLSSGTARVLISGAEDAAWVFPLDAEETLAVPGPLGDTVLEISGGRARIRSSPCENQSCVAAGWLRGKGEWTACLPNQVFLAIEGEEGVETDAFAW